MILKTTTTFLALIFSTSVALSNVNAVPTNNAEEKGQKRSDNFVSSLEKVKDLSTFSTHVQYSLNSIVTEGISELRTVGQVELAAQFEAEWNQQFASALMNRDLGDHTPLNEWLGYFYKNLEMNLGIQKMKDTRMYDLKVFNFGIPVVLHPTGNAELNESWDKEEYARHFVPVFASTTYWGSLAACTYVASQVSAKIKPFCKTISRIAEKAVTSSVAAKLSDAIYERAQN